MNSKLSLLYPEWQSSGETACVYHGALKLAAALSKFTEFTCVDVPATEQLEKVDGVLGLRSIAPRFRSTLDKLRKEAQEEIFMVGGTCGVEVAPIGYLNEKYAGDLAVIWFDAHADLNTPNSSPSGHFHGMALRTLLGEGPHEYTTELARFLLPSQIFLAGTRDLDPPELEYISSNGLSITPFETFKRPQELVKKIQRKGFRNVYIHLDLDVLNPESFADALMRTPGGPTVKEMQGMLRALATEFQVVGFSVVEYCEHQGDSIDLLTDLVVNSGVTIASNGPAMSAQAHFPDSHRSNRSR
jgi:arginase